MSVVHADLSSLHYEILTPAPVIGNDDCIWGGDCSDLLILNVKRDACIKICLKRDDCLYVMIQKDSVKDQVDGGSQVVNCLLRSRDQIQDLLNQVEGESELISERCLKPCPFVQDSRVLKAALEAGMFHHSNQFNADDFGYLYSDTFPICSSFSDDWVSIYLREKSGLWNSIASHLRDRSLHSSSTTGGLRNGRRLDNYDFTKGPLVFTEWDNTSRLQRTADWNLCYEMGGLLSDKIDTEEYPLIEKGCGACAYNPSVEEQANCVKCEHCSNIVPYIVNNSTIRCYDKHQDPCEEKWCHPSAMKDQDKTMPWPINQGNWDKVVMANFFRDALLSSSQQYDGLHPYRFIWGGDQVPEAYVDAVGWDYDGGACCRAELFFADNNYFADSAPGFPAPSSHRSFAYQRILKQSSSTWDGMYGMDDRYPFAWGCNWIKDLAVREWRCVSGPQIPILKHRNNVWVTEPMWGWGLFAPRPYETRQNSTTMNIIAPQPTANVMYASIPAFMGVYTTTPWYPSYETTTEGPPIWTIPTNPTQEPWFTTTKEVTTIAGTYSSTTSTTSPPDRSVTAGTLPATTTTVATHSEIGGRPDITVVPDNTFTE